MKVTETVWQLAEPIAARCGCSIWDVEFVREGDAIRLALQNCSGAPAEACITLPDRRRNLTLPPWRITAVSLER